MSDGSTGAVGPVSVRYAAQIRELLYAQAVQRMVADEEAARALRRRTYRPNRSRHEDTGSQTARREGPDA